MDAGAAPASEAMRLVDSPGFVGLSCGAEDVREALSFFLTFTDLETAGAGSVGPSGNAGEDADDLGAGFE